MYHHCTYDLGERDGHDNRVFLQGYKSIKVQLTSSFPTSSSFKLIRTETTKLNTGNNDFSLSIHATQIDSAVCSFHEHGGDPVSED